MCGGLKLRAARLTGAETGGTLFLLGASFSRATCGLTHVRRAYEDVMFDIFKKRALFRAEPVLKIKKFSTRRFVDYG